MSRSCERMMILCSHILLLRQHFVTKLFTTKSIETVKYCREYFDFSLSSVLWAKHVYKFVPFLSALRLLFQFDLICILLFVAYHCWRSCVSSGWKLPREQSSARRRHLSSNADCFMEPLQNLFLLITSFLTVFGF